MEVTCSFPNVSTLFLVSQVININILVETILIDDNFVPNKAEVFEAAARYIIGPRSRNKYHRRNIFTPHLNNALIIIRIATLVLYDLRYETNLSRLVFERSAKHASTSAGRQCQICAVFTTLYGDAGRRQGLLEHVSGSDKRLWRFFICISPYRAVGESVRPSIFSCCPSLCRTNTSPQ
jgi:hypothetical protein